MVDWFGPPTVSVDEVIGRAVAAALEDRDAGGP